MPYLFRHKMDAYRLYLLMHAAAAMCYTLIFTVNMVYQVETVGLSPLQLVLVGTALEVTVFLFEVPTGIVADRTSRRLSIIIGYSLIGLGFMGEGLFPSFVPIVLAQVLWGIGHTFTSGADQAWISDEIGAQNAGRAFMRTTQIGSLVGVVITLVAVALGSLLINLPIVLGGAMFIGLAGFLALKMPETGFKPTPRTERSTWGQMTGTLRDGLRLVRRRPALLAILAIGLFFGLFSEGVDRLSTAHLLESFTLPDFAGLKPVAWIGLLGMVGGLLTAAAGQIVLKRINMDDGGALGRAAYGLSALLVASLFGFALAGSFAAAVITSWLIGIFRALIGPLQTAWMNQHIESSVRATVISMSGQVDAIGQMAGGPPVGLVGNRFGVRAALLTSASILLPVLALFPRALRREADGGKQPPASR